MLGCGCQKCGADKAQIIKEFKNCKVKSDEVDVNDFENIDNSEGNTQKVRSTITYTFHGFFIFLQAVLDEFSHSLARQNAKAFQHDISHVEEGECVLLMDFQMILGMSISRRYKLSIGQKRKTTIFPAIAYLKIDEKLRCILMLYYLMI